MKWATDFDQWNLYVDDMKTGQTVAQGIDVDSNGQSVLLSRPHNGDYKVTMVPFYTDFDKADLAYRGQARAFHDPSQRYAQKHLPSARRARYVIAIAMVAFSLLLTLTSARSLGLSVPMTFAISVRPSVISTRTSSAPSTT